MSEALELDQTIPHAEAQLAGLIFALMLIDPQLIIRTVNPAAETLFGQSAKRIVGRQLLELLSFEDEHVAAHFRMSDAPLLARNIALQSGDLNGRFNLSASCVARRDGWRVVTLSEAGMGDGGAQEDTRLLRTPAVLAHEIKNPLSAIRGAGQLLALKLDEKDKHLALMVCNEVDRIARLIDRMQRLGSETAEPVAPTNLHATIRSAIAAVRAADPEGVPVEEQFDPSLPQVLANEGSLRQVLVNLLANARTASVNVADPRVSVQTRYIGGLSFRAIIPGKSVALPVEITVSDNGPGVDRKLREHIFDPFVSSKPNGQGLGLPLVRKLLRDMNGRIAEERDERAGLTHFRIRLQVAD